MEPLQCKTSCVESSGWVTIYKILLAGSIILSSEFILDYRYIEHILYHVYGVPHQGRSLCNHSYIPGNLSSNRHLKVLLALVMTDKSPGSHKRLATPLMVASNSKHVICPFEILNLCPQIKRSQARNSQAVKDNCKVPQSILLG